MSGKSNRVPCHGSITTTCQLRMRKTIAMTVALVLYGCTESRKQDPAQPPLEVKEAVPVKIALFQDKSGSTNWSRTPQLTETTVKILIDILKEKSGELAFGLFRDHSNKGLVRLRIDARPAAPPEPEKTGRVYQDARAMNRYRREKAQHDEALERWEKEMEQRVKGFLADVRPLLEQPADARCTSIWEAVIRGDLYLAEDDASWPQPPHEWALYVTDGVHNCGPDRTARLKSGASLVVINGEAQTGNLASLQPKVFESIEAAFRYLSATEGGK
jgi:hypothetical protein